MRGFIPYTAMAFLLVLTISAIFTGVVTWILRRRAILDLPNDRSSHAVPTPRGGGWGLMLALLPAWIWATARAVSFDAVAETLAIVGAVALMAVSWVDDRRGLTPLPRFAVQIVAVGAVMATLPAALSISGGYLPLVVDRLLAGLLWLWFVNLFNFMDGIDGLSGGSAAAMGIGIALISIQQGPYELDAFRGAMIAAVALGFLLWNWHPAKVFMGDVGSIPLGYLLGYELVRLAMDGHRIPALIIPLYYLVDATVTLLRRGARRERVWRAHREHFYQRAVQRGRNHAKVAKMATLTQFTLVLLAMFSTADGLRMLIVALLLVIALLWWMMRPARPAAQPS